MTAVSCVKFRVFCGSFRATVSNILGLLLLEQANWTEATAEDSLAANR